MKDNNIENLYQASKADKPPKNLDNFILAQAKNSCDEKQYSHNTSLRKKWLFRLSTAAVLVLSFSIILNLQTQNELITEPVEYIQKSKISKPAVLQSKQENLVNSPMASTNYSERSASDSVIESDGEGLGAGQEIDIEEDFEEETHSNLNTFQESLNTPLDAMPAPVPSEPLIEDKQLGKVVDEITSPKKYSAKTETVNKKDSYELSAGANLSHTQSINDSDADAYESKEMANITSLKDDQLSFTQQLEQLDDLIKNQQLTEAKKLLTQLQELYPVYDFSKYKELLVD